MAIEGKMAQPEQVSSGSVSTDAQSELEDLRGQIDVVDFAILERLDERARLVQAVGRLKQSHGLPVYSGGREREIVERLAARGDGSFPRAGLAPVFREIISATRSLEQVLRVAYLGPEGTFAHLAASRQLGQLADLVGTPSIADVFASVERAKADLGVVPVENTTQGVVTQTLDAIVDADVTICGEIVLPISHALLSRSGALEGVKRIASHPQPLAQCRLWLERNLPGIERIETASTAAAARLAAEDGDVAAIASSIAADVYGLETIELAIEDRRDNTTRFLIIGKTTPPASGNDLTSVLFTTRKDQAGALHGLLEPFARCGVNLTSIQQRPIVGKPWEYLFFIDMEGHQSDEPVREALAAAAGIANSHRILGSFPRAAEPPGDGNRDRA
jgi:chorismate mutase/prephenate dehydratase